MSDNDFDSVFGRRPAGRPGFSERVTQGQAFGGRHDPIAAMAMEAASTAPTPGVYKPFGFIPAGTINQSCEVRSWMDATQIADGVVFFYRLLMQIGFTADSELRLMLPDTIIVLTGRHLEPLRQSLMRQQATYIQEYSRRVWPAAVPESETVVERIEILRP
jgi:hypothetical protein